MTTPLNKVGTVTDDTGHVYEGGQLVVKDGRALIRFQGSEQRNEPVASWENATEGRNQAWVVTLEDGSSWRVERKVGGCRTCGGR